MAVFQSAAEHLAAVERRNREIRKELAEHQKQVNEEEKKIVQGLLSGKISSAELRRRDHPFARRHNGRPPVPTAKLPINKQTGKLYRAIKTVIRRNARGQFDTKGNASVLVRGVPYSKAILGEKGTKTMVPRGFNAALNREISRSRKLNKLRIKIAQINKTGAL